MKMSTKREYKKREVQTTVSILKKVNTVVYQNTVNLYYTRQLQKSYIFMLRKLTAFTSNIGNSKKNVRKNRVNILDNKIMDRNDFNNSTSCRFKCVLNRKFDALASIFSWKTEILVLSLMMLSRFRGYLTIVATSQRTHTATTTTTKPSSGTNVCRFCCVLFISLHGWLFIYQLSTFLITPTFSFPFYFFTRQWVSVIFVHNKYLNITHHS